MSPLTSIWLAVLAAFQIQFVLRQVSVKAVHVEAAGAAAAASQECTDGPALTSVTHGVAEHFVNLLLWWHPPVWVWGTVHPDELWQDLVKKKNTFFSYIYTYWNQSLGLDRGSTQMYLYLSNVTVATLNLKSHYRDWGSVLHLIFLSQLVTSTICEISVNTPPALKQLQSVI